MKALLLLPFRLIALITGRFSWDAPSWLRYLCTWINRYRKLFFGLVLGGIMVCFIYWYVDSRPKPVSVMAVVEPPTLAQGNVDSKPSPLFINFSYDFAALRENQLAPEGAPSVARIDLVGQEIKAGVALSPLKEGRWTWLDDRRMQFVPETDWPAGTDYTVTFENSAFTDQTILSSQRASFTTKPLEIQVSSSEFYQDPKDISVRRVVATMKFSHPVEKESFESRLSMGLQPKGAPDSNFSKVYEVSVSYDENRRTAYLQSAPVSLPTEPSYMKFIVDRGVKTILGGEASISGVKGKVLVPDIYSFLKVQRAHTSIVRNSLDQPEQVLTLEFTDYIDQQELLSKLSLFQLPMRDKHGGRPRASLSHIDDEVLSASTQVSFAQIANERDSSKVYNFVIDVPESAQLYLNIDEQLTSVNKFVHASPYQNIVRAPSYPKEVKLVGDGSVLTHSGNHKLSVVTRGVSDLKYSVGKVLKGKINHLVSQTNGDITSPAFKSWNFNQADLVEYESKIVSLKQTHPKQANHSSFDLSEYLASAEERFGLFFVDVADWDKTRNYASSHLKDKRLILVTDLGLIVKDNADQSHDVFIQSIADGMPVAGAKVELLGRNGVAIMSAVSNARGHVAFGSTKGFDEEKAPTVYIVKTDQDMSFIPFERQSRQINLSKFDIGGVRSRRDGEASLKGFLFSDRGIYRPSEIVNLGMIVKNDDLSNVEGIPLEVVIRGPRNKEVKVSRFNLPKKGFADFQYATEATSDTGQHTASLHLVRDGRYRGSQIGSVGFKVEEFQPDTMRIQSQLEGVSDIGWNTSEQVSSQITLNNLFGTAAQDRKLGAFVNITPTNFRFDKFKDYRFTEQHFDTENKPLSLNESLPEQRTDVNGKARYDIDLSKFNNGTYRLNFTVEGFDQAGGRSVKAFNSILISPLEYIVGYKADGSLGFIKANSERSIDFISVDKTLNKFNANGLTLKLIEIQQVSTLVKQSNGTYKYQTIKKEREVSSSPLDIPSDGYRYAINSNEPGDFALEVYDDGNRRMSRVEYSVAGFADMAGKIDKNAELRLTLNKSDYRPGELIEMSIKAPYAGAGLITVETDKVHQFKWFKTAQQSSVQQIKLPSDIEGTAYINVSFARDVSSEEIFTSPLSYAVQPFSIDRSKRQLDIDIGVAPLVRPGKTMEITYSVSKPSRIAIFAVDEGILQVANYQTPEPLAHFLKKRALGVETLQILDLILPDFDLVKQLSASGGGSGSRAALAKNLNPFSRKKDKPAVFWSGIYDADKSRQSVNFEIPNTFSGELRVMAVAVADEALGVESTSTIVRGPFVISPNVLNMVAPGDEFDVTVGVANIIEGSGKGASVQLTASTSEHLEIMGEPASLLSIDEGSEGRLTFRVRAKQSLGAAELSFTASYKDEQLTRSAGLSVRPATPYITDVKGGYSKSGSFDLSLPRTVYPDLAKQSVSASASPLMVVDGLSAYLETYPHGCTEQIVSKVFPVVGLLAHPAYSAHLPNVKLHFDYLIDRLRERQMADGGFSFWPGSQRSVEYPTIYAMHFLIEANELGYAVPSSLLVRGKEYLQTYVQRHQTELGQQRDRANAIYLLTRLGDVTSNYLVDLEESLSQDKSAMWRNDILSVYMAATYKLLQNDSDAARLIKDYKIDNGHNQVLDDFHSSLAMDAQYIYLLSKHFSKRALSLGGEKVLTLSERIYQGQYNTISSAYSILAIGAYSQLALPDAKIENINFAATDTQKNKRILEALATPFMTANYPVDTKELHVDGETPLFYLNVQSGFSRNPPKQAIKEGIEIFRDFTDENGKTVSSFEQGKEIIVRLKVRALGSKPLSNIAIVDLLPGGFEVVRDSVPRTAYNWRADYVDIREDRVIYYGSFDNHVTELSYKVKLTASGEFIVPPSYAESMYDRSVRANTEASRFIVTAKP